MASDYGSERSARGTATRTLIVVALVIAVAIVLIVRERNGADARGVTAEQLTGEEVSSAGSCVVDAGVVGSSCGIGGTCVKRGSSVPAAVGEPPAVAEADAVPRLLDLGADKCVPCKEMAPILDEMRREFDGRLDVDFVDVWKNPEYAREYGVKVIPTQIFMDPEGNELFRHQGFFSREDILSKWRELGYPIDG